MMQKAWSSIEEVPYCFLGVIHQISRSQGLINRWFESNLSKITKPVAAIKSLRFALFCIGMEHVVGMFPAKGKKPPVLHKEPGHQQPWYWTSSHGIVLVCLEYSFFAQLKIHHQEFECDCFKEVSYGDNQESVFLWMRTFEFQYVLCWIVLPTFSLNPWGLVIYIYIC